MLRVAAVALTTSSAKLDLAAQTDKLANLWQIE